MICAGLREHARHFEELRNRPRYCAGPYGFTRKCAGSRKIARYAAGSYGIARNCAEFWRIAWEPWADFCGRMSEIERNSTRTRRTVLNRTEESAIWRKCPVLCEIVRENPRLRRRMCAIARENAGVACSARPNAPECKRISGDGDT